MTRIFGHYVALEMFFLWLLEFVPCFLAIYVLVAQAPGGSAGWIDLAAVNHAVILALTIGLTSICIGLYRPEICLQTRRLLVNTAVAGVLAFPAVLAVGEAAGIDTSFLLGDSPLRPLQFLLTWILFLFATRLAFSVAMRLNLLSRRVLIIGAPQHAARTEEAVRALRRGFFTVAGIASAHDAALLAPAALLQQRIWGVVVTAEARGAVPRAELLGCKYAGVRIFSDVEFREQQLRRIDLDHLEADWMLFADGLSRGRIEQALRRAGDILVSLLLLVATLPVMALAAVLIRLDSPGPILYRQERVGLQGRVFTLMKFRSMRVDAEARGPAWAAQKDPRVTRIGAFLRRTRIDELPQLVNVLRGEMSFVGPRPERPHFVDQLAEVIPFYRDRASVKPGITGWAQVNFPYGASVEDARQKLSYDLYYVKHRSLFLDILILLATVRVILFQEGAR
ncbi:TIGR03013 family XrtA/PEP-CTERM system glycosyltransferase [Limobrevibacterium gyesilva]|uniref:TIGR03013 family PEP-CTERM/XrtA system glycosyltransferase n=1 Tax=Limobrevibacterium gyesilva TaxID=2991712 RepID=A0AA42CF79_9PROT|nr:TIGR03013 family XrtA/PEP-CTERM system glycosyltransferase [Limobrevibacterium gyesilva]MCW3476913.1 TIGR03013 family PEP-CTERM/XrtA system glycosyltransferase [Limobrevibacterium gyesilva]